MPAIKPTHTAIRAISSPGRYLIQGHPGLYLRVRESGTKTWMVRSDAGGTTRYKILGTVTAVSFASAAAAAAELRDGAPGVNTIDAARTAARDAIAAAEMARTAERRAEALRPTVGAIATKYLGMFVAEKRRALGEKRSADEDRRVYVKHIEPMLGHVKLDELRTSMVASMRDDIEAPSERRKAVAVLRALLSQAVSDGLTESNPAMGIKSAPSTPRARVLTDEEIKSIWSSKAIEGVRPGMLSALKLQLLTGQRAGEVLALRWTDINSKAKIWTIPASVAKNGREHAVPLSPSAWKEINAQPRDGDLVFPAHRAAGRVSSSVFAQLVTRLRRELKLAPFGSHDLRRTAATRMAGLGTSPHVIEAVLNHVSGIVSGIAAVYIRESYLAEKRAALEAWAREVSRISARNRVCRTDPTPAR